MNKLSDADIVAQVRSKVSVQSYSPKQKIDGLKVVENKRFVGEDGTFEELVRINDSFMTEAFPDFKVAQINRSKLLPGAIKGWHIHYNQEDIWYVTPEDHVLLGLWDIRESSSSKDVKMKISLGGGTSRLIYIPRGVAHGVANISAKEASLIYFVNQQFNAADPDERRLAWDVLGAEFWVPEKG